MTTQKVKNLIKNKLNNYLKGKKYGNLEYEYSNKVIKWKYGEDIIIYKLNGLFPKGYSDKEGIHLKFLTGKGVEYGAIVTFSIEMNISEGILADMVLNSKFNFIKNDHIFRLYSSMLNRTKYFKNSKISFYKNDIDFLDERIDELIKNIEIFFIKPQSLIYNMDSNLLDYIDDNYAFFSYPFLSKVMIYAYNNEKISEVDIVNLGNNNFPDYKYKNDIIKRGNVSEYCKGFIN